MSFNAVFNGPPVSFASPADAPVFGVDVVNKNGYVGGTNAGWIPFAPSTVAKVATLGLTANTANLLTYAVVTSGLYRVDLYEVSANAATGATLPAMTVVYTDVDTTGSITQTLADVTAVGAANVANQGGFVVNAEAGTNIVVATTSYAAGSGTALSYNAKARVTYLG
jgi:hypothetical protein